MAGITNRFGGENGMRLLVPLVAVACLALGQSASAAKTPRAISPLVNALEQCRKIADSAQRLGCYDRAAPALVDASRAGEITVVDRGQLRQARRSLFGFSMPRLPFFAGDESAADSPSELQTTIKSARSLGNGKYRIVLTENDAVWETTEESMGLREPRAGQKISIRRGPLGSYFLRVDGGRSVKGRRVG
jgi:hypothetical protein